MAQTVAVTEVIDKEDKVSLMIKTMVRTNLTKAISNKQGYSAYDRVDLSSIMGEHNFQRTGFVNDETIKKLGEMAGADLVMIPEVAKNDDGQIYVSVKMLDVTTAKTMFVDGQSMGSSTTEVESGCLKLVTKILDDKQSSSNSMLIADSAVTLFGYLHIYPKDLGEFQSLPAQLLNAINKQGDYGFDSWRLPTEEELTIMRASSSSIPNFKNADYLCSDSPKRGIARLVTTEKSIKEKRAIEEAEARERARLRRMRAEKSREIRKKAIFNLLGVYSNYDEYFISSDGVYCTRNFQFLKDDNPVLFDEKIAHPNRNFVRCDKNRVLIMCCYAEFCRRGEIYFLGRTELNEKDTVLSSSGWTEFYDHYNYEWYSTYNNHLFVRDICFYVRMYDDGGPVVIKGNSIVYDGTNFTFYVMYHAPLPAEYLIKNKMRELGYIEE